MNTDKIYAESIVNQYSKKEESKVIALKKLDKKAKNPSLIFGLTFGIISALVFGTGLSLSMQVIGSGTLMIILGLGLGVLGMLGCAINYPIYKKMRKAGMNKYANDIIMLANEITEE